MVVIISITFDVRQDMIAILARVTLLKVMAYAVLVQALIHEYRRPSLKHGLLS